jgi:hypothetical protein
VPEPDPVSWFVVEPGWKVLTSDGSEVGTVHETLGDQELDIFDGLAVSRSPLSKPAYVPSEHVGEIREGEIHLTLTSKEVEALEPVD